MGIGRGRQGATSYWVLMQIGTSNSTAVLPIGLDWLPPESSVRKVRFFLTD